MTAWVARLRQAWQPTADLQDDPVFPEAVRTLSSLAPPGSEVRTWRHAGLGVDLAWLSAPADHRRADGPVHPRWYIQGERRWLVWSESAAWAAIHASMRREESLTQTLQLWPGRFCGVCLDTAERRTHVFTDRFGLQRVFTCRQGSALYVASRALPLVRSLPALQTWDLEAVAQVMATGSALHGATLFRGLQLVPPASCWSHHPDNRLQQTSYYRWPPAAAETPSAPSVWEEQLHHHLQQAVTHVTRDESPMGMSLTGGWDGRLIMAYCERPPSALPCYTFSGPWRECADARIAREVAGICQQPFQILQAASGWTDRFAGLATQVVRASDGAMDVSAALELEMNHQARQVAPIRLTGNWGSEVLRSHVALKSRPDRVRFLDRSWAPRLQEAHLAYLALRQQPPLPFILQTQMPWHHTARLAVEDAVVEVRSPFLDHALVECMLRRNVPLQSMGTVLGRLLQRQAPALAQVPTDRSDRAIAQVGWPAWRHRWKQAMTTAQIKAEYWSDYGMPQSLVRVDHWLGPWSPAQVFLGRHKFAHYRRWYQHELAPWVQSVLLSSRALTRGIYEPSALRRMVLEHLSGRGNHTLELHRALTLELVAQEFFVPPTSRSC